MTEYAPNFRKSVINYQVLAPADLEATFGLTGQATPITGRRLKNCTSAARPPIPAEV